MTENVSCHIFAQVYVTVSYSSSMFLPADWTVIVCTPTYIYDKLFFHDQITASFLRKMEPPFFMKLMKSYNYEIFSMPYHEEVSLPYHGQVSLPYLGPVSLPYLKEVSLCILNKSHSHISATFVVHRASILCNLLLNYCKHPAVIATDI